MIAASARASQRRGPGSGVRRRARAARARRAAVRRSPASAGGGRSTGCAAWTTGPGAALGTFGWFLGAWVVMMAAMMFPSVAPTVALYSRMTRQRSPLAPLLFTAGYLVDVGGGRRARVRRRASAATGSPATCWPGTGRAAGSPAATLLVAAVYELTPLKDVCLGKCRSPLGFLLGAWRDGWAGALRMGADHGAWCVGCCWALMASLFALGVMSIAWMAFVAALIAAEKLLPWRRSRPTAPRRSCSRSASCCSSRPTPSRPDITGHDARCRCRHAPLDRIRRPRRPSVATAGFTHRLVVDDLPDACQDKAARTGRRFSLF